MTAIPKFLALAMFAGLGAACSQAAVPGAPGPISRPPDELAASARTIVERGYHARLPAHISTLLGLTHEKECAVMQAFLRSDGRVQGVDVTEQNHNDIVIFVVDEATSGQMLYLTSSAGRLRRVLAVDGGIGRVVSPAKADLEAFQKEKKMWEQRLAALQPAR